MRKASGCDAVQLDPAGDVKHRCLFLLFKQPGPVQLRAPKSRGGFQVHSEPRAKHLILVSWPLLTISTAVEDDEQMIFDCSREDESCSHADNDLEHARCQMEA